MVRTEMTSAVGSAALELLHDGAPGQPDWQVLIGEYLHKRLDMHAPEIFTVLRDCESDEIERMRYMKIARGAMQ
jgi:hypothetical protein